MAKLHRATSELVCDEDEGAERTRVGDQIQHTARQVGPPDRKAVPNVVADRDSVASREGFVIQLGRYDDRPVARCIAQFGFHALHIFVHACKDRL
jgi:hypothetical protein